MAIITITAQWDVPSWGQGSMVSMQSHLLHPLQALHVALWCQGDTGQSCVPLSLQLTFGRSRRSAWGRTHGTLSVTPRMLASSTSLCASSSSMGWTSGCGHSAWLVSGLPPHPSIHPYHPISPILHQPPLLPLAFCEEDINLWITGLNWLVADTQKAQTPLQIER